MPPRRTVAHCLSRLSAFALASTLASGIVAAQNAPARAGDWSAVDAALGRTGAAQPGGVMKYGFPRTDLQVTANGVVLKPAFALGSWVAFSDASGPHAMMMGDLVLTEDEVGPVMRALQEGGIEQTALHNHLLRESPRVMYMHISGHGSAATLARAVRTALASSRTPLTAPMPAVPAATQLDTATLARTLGRAGKLNGGVYQVSVPRAEKIREDGREVPSSMGVSTAINFQSTGDSRAAITGDFVMTASEVNPVIRALEASGIEVTAIHSHMLVETPRLFFMHFWANGDATALARGLRSALDRMATLPARRDGAKGR